MENIIIPKTTITTDQYAVCARHLAAAIMLQATRDYCKSKSDSKRAAILKDLRSAHMDFLSDGMAVVVAEQLEKHPEEIAERLRRQSGDVV